MQTVQSLESEFPHLNFLRLKDNEGRVLELEQLTSTRTRMTLYDFVGKPVKREEAKASIKDVANQFLARWRIENHVLDYEVVEALAVLHDCLRYSKGHVLKVALSTMPELVHFLLQQQGGTTNVPSI